MSNGEPTLHCHIKRMAAERGHRVTVMIDAQSGKLE
jgi:hypothetical protein